MTWPRLLYFILELLALAVAASPSAAPILVVGSINADVIVPLERLPMSGETVIAVDREDLLAGTMVPGGKGANQAVAAQRLGSPTTFICTFGSDSNAAILQETMRNEGIDISLSSSCSAPSGTGLVLLVDGGSTCIVAAGSNNKWDEGRLESDLSELWKGGKKPSCVLLQMEVPQQINECVARAAHKAGVPVFQDAGGADRPISDEHLRLCTFISPNLSELRRLVKNTSVDDKVSSSSSSSSSSTASDGDHFDEAAIMSAVKSLQARGARGVLVTLGSQGSLLVTEDGKSIYRQGAWPLPQKEEEGGGGGKAVDETGAGDNFRAAFCVARFSEGRPLEESLQLAACAGAVAVSRLGAIPACCNKNEQHELWEKHRHRPELLSKVLSLSGGAGDAGDAVGGGYFFGLKLKSLFGFGWSENHSDTATIKGGDVVDKDEAQDGRSRSSTDPSTGNDKGNDKGNDDSEEEEECPFHFATRLNSMSARFELFEDAPWGLTANGGGKPVAGIASGVRSWIRRLGKIRGLSRVFFNYPQHLTQKVTPEAKAEILSSLSASNLTAGAICLRFPKEKFQAGALTHPIPERRSQALELCGEACEWAAALGAPEVVIWSAFCGYDYPLQVDYHQLWTHLVTALQQLCDKHPKIKISLEFKPTDENTRYFAVPSTGAAVLLERQVGRKNFGLTLDFGHCLLAGENPGQSCAMVNQLCTSPNKLFGVQLGDGHSRIGAEDGLAFGSVHRLASLEFVYQLVKSNFAGTGGTGGTGGTIYFDTFPRNEDPVRECEFNIRSFKKMWALARRMQKGRGKAKIEGILARHDALAMLEYLE